ncbi:hypothetical protein F0562_031055 [Nyssa sinensis]|uniref:Uncharacterized protein n=1 Tax=Nyssa sinensis TaxID=561372 RepID=A0A5J5AX35_9ASTE|nr:hypothetical protein F0562_031055 [Nyssa sinensis]
MAMEIFLDPNRDLVADDPIINPINVSKAIKDSILINFGECGLASSLGSFQVKYMNPITNLCIIRASREEYQKVCHHENCLSFVVGACIKKIQKQYLTRQTILSHRSSRSLWLVIDELKLNAKLDCLKVFNGSPFVLLLAEEVWNLLQSALCLAAFGLPSPLWCLR